MHTLCYIKVLDKLTLKNIDEGVPLAGVIFNETALPGDLVSTEMVLSVVLLSGAKLTGAFLSGAKMTLAYLSGVVMTGAVLWRN